MAQLDLTASEQLTYSTTRIACWQADGSMGTGSGFFFAFAKQGEKNVPAIVTNKHVVRGAARGQFTLTLRGPDSGPIVGQHLTIELDNFESRWIAHPDPAVDLCAMPISPLLHEAEAQKRTFFFITLDESLLPSDDDLKGLGALEEIVMIGYPNGIWDSTNNMPILRRGVTATHPNLNYEGRLEFMIDAACFPGSSGSPVFLFNVGSWPDRRGNIIMGGLRIKLLGILYAGPQHTATGEIRIVNIPTQQRAVAFSTIPNNLGLVVKASRLRDIDSIMRAKVLPPAAA
jgi:hypothetical protein